MDFDDLTPTDIQNITTAMPMLKSFSFCPNSITQKKLVEIFTKNLGGLNEVNLVFSLGSWLYGQWGENLHHIENVWTTDETSKTTDSTLWYD